MWLNGAASKDESVCTAAAASSHVYPVQTYQKLIVAFLTFETHKPSLAAAIAVAGSVYSMGQPPEVMSARWAT